MRMIANGNCRILQCLQKTSLSPDGAARAGRLRCFAQYEDVVFSGEKIRFLISYDRAFAEHIGFDQTSKKPEFSHMRSKSNTKLTNQKLVFLSILGVTFFLIIGSFAAALTVTYRLVHGDTFGWSIVKLALWNAIRGGLAGGVAMFVLGHMALRYRKNH